MNTIIKKLSLRTIYCFLILVLAMSSGLFAQDIQFDHLNKSDGFPSGWIYSLVQDKQGFLWVGGLQGISRYDGYKIKTYRNEPLDSTSLSNNFVYALYVDRGGRLWAGTWSGGLNLFDSGKEKFTNFKRDPGNSTSLSSDSVNVILQTTDGTIWVGTQNGLDRFDNDKRTFITSNVINALYEDQDGNLWVGTGDATDPKGKVGGLNRYDSTADNFIRVLPTAQKSLRDNRVTAIAGAPNGAIYIGTCQSGLYLYDPMGSKLEALGDDPIDLKHLHAPQGIKTSNFSAKVDVIHRDKTGMLWVATHSGGINRYDPATHTLTPYRQEGDPKSLSSNLVLSFYEDHQGILWFGTEGAGLNKIVPSFSRFRLYGAKEISANNGVRSLYQESKDTLWIGTFSGQLFRMDPSTGNIERFSDTKPAPDGLWGNPVESVFKDREGMLWVGQQRGLYRINPVRKSHRKFTADAANPDSLSNSNIMFIRQSDDQHLWIGTWGGGLNLYNFKTNRFRHFQHDPSDPKSLSNNKLMQMYTDYQGILWFGTEDGGLDRFDKKTETFTTYLDGEGIFQIYEDSSDRFWVTTLTDGMFLLDRNTGKTIHHYTTEDGLPNNVVPGIMQDKQGMLWLATSGGVARFDPETKTFITYDEADGINNYPVIQQAVIKGIDDRMFIGGPKGVTAINPQNFKPNPNPPVTAITGLHIFENPFPLPPNQEEQITLRYNQNELTFDYAGLHFANPSRNRYTYRLEGYDKNWIDAGTARRAKYTNLSPGTYTFRVKSSNSDGIWDEKGTSLTIKILPPWWRTTAAYIIYALLGIALVFGLDRFLRRRLVAKERERTRELELEQAHAALQQSSLDRVRAEIASMRTAKDLERVTPLIWRELKALEVPFIRCGVFIVDEANKSVGVFLTTPDGKALGVLHLAFDSNDLTSNTVKHWKNKQVYKEHWNKEEFINWTKSMMELGQVQNPETYQGSSQPPESLYLHFVPFEQGMLYIGNVDPLDEEKLELTKTLAEAFSIAYARYEDFNNLEEAKAAVEVTLSELKSAQSQLVHSEKMASLGELTAGIAHEIKNPLNFVNNFSEVSGELLDEMKEELKNKNEEEVASLIEDLKQNLGKINHHGKRADSIVKGMLLHSRGTSGEKTLTDINDLLDQYVNLAYHGMRAMNKEFNITIEKNYDKSLEKVNVVPQDISRVFLNIINNACYAAYDRKKKGSDNNFSPTLKVSTKNLKDKVEIRIGDNGKGVPKDILDKIFQPFFTTKPTGEGTGLGLSLSYDIVTKMHNGDLKVESEEGKYTEFVIVISKQ